MSNPTPFGHESPRRVEAPANTEKTFTTCFGGWGNGVMLLTPAACYGVTGKESPSLPVIGDHLVTVSRRFQRSART